jgi:small subunit ribosomal protein S4
MAKYTGPSCRICRREGCKLFLKGERCFSGKCAVVKRPTPPGQHKPGRRKMSDYGMQLREKQKMRRAYGLLEGQFRSYFDRAHAKRGNTGELLLQMLECRLDNVAYRVGFGDSRAQARQMVLHSHVLLNGKKVNIPSYQVKVGDAISVKPGSRDVELFKTLREGPARNVPKWLEFNADALEARVLALPERDDIDLTLSEHLVVEYYSKL